MHIVAKWLIEFFRIRISIAGTSTAGTSTLLSPVLIRREKVGVFVGLKIFYMQFWGLQIKAALIMHFLAQGIEYRLKLTRWPHETLKKISRATLKKWNWISKQTFKKCICIFINLQFLLTFAGSMWLVGRKFEDPWHRTYSNHVWYNFLLCPRVELCVILLMWLIGTFLAK